MKLYNVPKGSFIRVFIEPDIEYILHFHHLDGAYSLCNDIDRNPIHIAAWAEVEVIDKPEKWDKKYE